MAFSRPSSLPAMPTYRVMDSDGVIVDTKHEPSDVSTEEVITWYKNMLTGMSIRFWLGNMSIKMDEADIYIKVNVMDVIMFEAQRQGRLSFYMVRVTGQRAVYRTGLTAILIGLGGRRRYRCRICLCVTGS